MIEITPMTANTVNIVINFYCLQPFIPEKEKGNPYEKFILKFNPSYPDKLLIYLLYFNLITNLSFKCFMSDT